MAPKTLSTTDQALLRLDAFAWIESRQQEKGWLSWDELLHDYHFHGMHIALIGQRGIINPSVLDETLCVQTSFKSPYLDDNSTGPVTYKFEAQHGPTAGSNIKLRRALANRVPIVYLQGVATGKYVAWVNVFVVQEDLENEHVVIDLDPAASALTMSHLENEIEKTYALTQAKRRVHQPKFRAEVLLAYETKCAICRLKHGELLDAAHIVPDSDSRGVAAVRNGLALCKIHHTAYDKQLLGISPDYEVHVNAELLLEVDGPMLKHGIQAMHGTQIHTPHSAKQKPDKELLAITYDSFLKSA
jgi:putative restriction endonuclease